MEYINLIQVKDIIGDYANMTFDKNMNATYKKCDICKKTTEKYYHIGSDPLYILNDSPGEIPILMKRNPYDYNWILVKLEIREKYFPNDMIWVRNTDIIKLYKLFPNMEFYEFYEFICNLEFFQSEFKKDFKIITYCSDCKDLARKEVENVDKDFKNKNDFNILK